MYGVGAEFGLDEARALGRKVLEGKLSDTAQVTARTIKRKGWSGLTTNEAVDAALAYLAEAQWLTLEPENRDGRQFVAIKVNPRVFELGEAHLLPSKEYIPPPRATRAPAPPRAESEQAEAEDEPLFF